MRGSRLALAVIAVGLCSLPARAQHLEVPARVLPFASSWIGGGSDVAVGADGDVVVTWEEVLSDNHAPLPRDLVVQRLRPDLTLHGSQLRTAISPHVDAALPRIAADPLGGYALTWTGGRVGTDVAIMGWRLDEAAALFGTAVTVDLRDDNQAASVGSKVAVLGNREAIIAWVDSAAFATLARRVDRFGIPLTPPFVLFNANGYVPFEIAALPGGGFAALARLGAAVLLRVFENDGTPRGDQVVIATGLDVPRLAVRPFGDLLAAVGTRAGSGAASEIVLIRFTSTGSVIDEQTVHGVASGRLEPSVAFDVNGSLLVSWWEQLGGSVIRARGFDPAGSPIGPAVTLESTFGTSVGIHTVRAADGLRFVNAWSSRNAGAAEAHVVSLCTPGASVCGNGTLDPLCELCDDGAANSDVATDACRTTCRPAACGDGVVDTGEGCDDGNTESCDGCNPTCVPEVGLGCGDGVPFPTCGETCDDGNFVDRDGCAADCTLERIPGGGAPATDCVTAWSVNDPSNLPYLDKRGAVSALQRCTDGDAGCDFDGVAGTCTFRVRVCANNRGFADCTPGARLASWQLFAPSAKAARTPALAAARAALLTVPGMIVGPEDPDVCTPFLDLPVALRGDSGGYRSGKLMLKTRAELYDGGRDLDKLRLVCDPPAP